MLKWTISPTRSISSFWGTFDCVTRFFPADRGCPVVMVQIRCRCSKFHSCEHFNGFPSQKCLIKNSKSPRWFWFSNCLFCWWSMVFLSWVAALFQIWDWWWIIILFIFFRITSLSWVLLKLKYKIFPQGCTGKRNIITFEMSKQNKSCFIFSDSQVQHRSLLSPLKGKNVQLFHSE